MRKNINVSRIVGVAEHLPIRDNVVNAVIMHGALLHFEKPVKGIKETCRVIAKGGRIYIYDYDLSSFSTKHLRIIEKLMGFPGNFFKIHGLLNVFSKLKCRERIAKYSHGEFFNDYV